jgi:hypothetical protein
MMGAVLTMVALGCGVWSWMGWGGGLTCRSSGGPELHPGAAATVTTMGAARRRTRRDVIMRGPYHHRPAGGQPSGAPTRGEAARTLPGAVRMNRTSFLRAAIPAVLAASAGMLAVSCLIKGPCTDVGCESMVGARLSDILTRYAADMPLTIQLCLDGACVTATVSAAGANNTCAQGLSGPICCDLADASPAGSCEIQTHDVFISLPVDGDEGSAHTVAATVQSQGGQVLFSGQKTATLGGGFSPNGVECGPTCYSGTVTFVSQ